MYPPDAPLAAAARALAAGDPLGALKHVALRDDPPALALRGTAMAQLGDYDRARKLFRRAGRGFGPRERLARARCQVAEAEVALAARDLSGPARALDTAARTLDALGDSANARFARVVDARRRLLVGDLEAAGRGLAAVDTASAPSSLAARAELTRAELALRWLRVAEATAALARAYSAAVAAGIPALLAEVDRARRALSAPSARLIRGGVIRPVRLDEVESVFTSGELVVDACRRAVRGPARSVVALAGRPVLFALARALAEAWPADVPRDELIARAFEARAANESLRARLRVEMGRLRVALRPLARIEATRRGFALVPAARLGVVVLAPPIDGPAGAIVALLEGGEAWSTSALAVALGSSQRTVQRDLRRLEAAAAVRAVGHGRSRRWLAPPLGGFATTLLLPGALPVA
jgi:DNA-binding transcriptional ArsR family regulator